MERISMEMEEDALAAYAGAGAYAALMNAVAIMTPTMCRRNMGPLSPLSTPPRKGVGG